MKNVRKDVELIECLACGAKSIVETGLKNAAFECEKCGNEIFVDEKGKMYVIGTLEKVNNVNNPEPVQKEVNESKPETNTEKSKFDLL